MHDLDAYKNDANLFGPDATPLWSVQIGDSLESPADLHKVPKLGGSLLKAGAAYLVVDVHPLGVSVSVTAEGGAPYIITAATLPLFKLLPRQGTAGARRPSR